MIRLLMSETSCGRSPHLGVVPVLLLILLFSGHQEASGQDQSDEHSVEAPGATPEEQMTDEPPGSENEPQTPDSASDTQPRRRIFKRVGPQPMTAEQREEAERLRTVAAKYGTDPTAIVGRLQLTSQYLDLSHGAEATVSTVRVDVPFRGDYLLRMEMPFLRTTTPNRPGVASQSGASDLAVIAGWRAYNTPEYALLVGALGTFPTAAHDSLGFGKYTVGPAVATARFLPRLESFLIGLLQYQTSVGGDPSRKDVSFFSVTAQVNSFWGQRWWTILQSVWQVDFERSGKSSMVMEFEGGRNLIGRFGAYVRPGVGIYGRDVAGAYIWNIEVGVRYMFTSF
jgi:hypothetical protein